MTNEYLKHSYNVIFMLEKCESLSLSHLIQWITLVWILKLFFVCCPLCFLALHTAAFLGCSSYLLYFYWAHFMKNFAWYTFPTASCPKLCFLIVTNCSWWWFIEMEPCYVLQFGLEPDKPLPQPSKSWNGSCAPPCLAKTLQGLCIVISSKENVWWTSAGRALSFWIYKIGAHLWLNQICDWSKVLRWPLVRKLTQRLDRRVTGDMQPLL